MTIFIRVTFHPKCACFVHIQLLRAGAEVDRKLAYVTNRTALKGSLPLHVEWAEVEEADYVVRFYKSENREELQHLIWEYTVEKTH